MIQWIQYKHQIAAACLKRPEEMTIKQLAHHFDITTHTVYYWIERNIVQARKIDERGPWWITLDTTQEQSLRHWIHKSANLRDQHTNL